VNKNRRTFRTGIACVLALHTAAFGLAVSTAQAATISTQMQLSAAQGQGLRDQILQAMARDDVQQQLIARGVNPAEARQRVASLSDSELAELQQRMDQLPAGSGALAVVGVVAIVLLVLDLAGILHVFNRR
jgi:parvulin-like peptidyl-prolyl isomerase